MQNLFIFKIKGRKKNRLTTLCHANGCSSDVGNVHKSERIKKSRLSDSGVYLYLSVQGLIDFFSFIFQGTT